MADMRDFQREQQKQEQSSHLSGLIKVSAVGAIGYGAVKYRHTIAAPLVRRAMESKTLGRTGNILSDAFGRGETFINALGTKPGFNSFVRNAMDPSDFERRTRIAYRAQQAARNQEGQLKNAPRLARRTMEHISSEKSLHHEAIKMARVQYGKQAVKENKALEPYLGQGLERMLIDDGMFSRRTTQQGVVRFLDKYSGEKAKKTSNFHLDFSGQPEGAKESFVDELFNTLHQTTSRIGRKYDKETGGLILNKAMSDEEKKFVRDRIEVLGKLEFNALMKSTTTEANASFMNNSMALQGFDVLRGKDFANGANKELYNQLMPIDRSNGKRKRLDFLQEIRRNAERYGESPDIVNEMVIDGSWYINRKTNKIIDGSNVERRADKGVEFLRNNFQVPFLNFNPIDLIQYSSIKASKDAPLFRVFKEGQTMAFANKQIFDMESKTFSNAYETADSNMLKRNSNAAVTPLAKDYAYSGNASYDIDTLVDNLNKVKGDITKLDVNTGKIEDNLILVSNEFGVPKRFTESMAGVTQHDGEIGLLRAIWGGRQENESIGGRIKRGLTKGNNPDYGPNLLDALKGKQSVLEVEETYNRMTSLLSRGTRGMSHDAHYFWGEELNKSMNKAYGIDIDFARMGASEEYTIDVAQQLSNVIAGRKKMPEEDMALIGGAQRKVLDIFENYNKEQALFMRQQTTAPDKSLISSEFINIASVGYDRLIPQTEDLRKSIEQLSLASYRRATGKTIEETMNEGLKNGMVRAPEIQETLDLQNLTRLESFGSRIKNEDIDVSTEGLKEFKSTFNQGTAYESMMGSMKRKDPAFGPGPGDEIVEHYGKDVHFQMIKRHRGMLETINQGIEDFAGENGSYAEKAYGVAHGVGDYFGHLFASNKKMENVTAGTMVPWFFASRLDDAMAQLGLGLGNNLRGSAMSIIMNQWARRIVLPYVAYQQAMYFDGLTGDTISDTAADGYVNMQMDTAKVKEKLGINDIGRSWSRVFAGTDQMAEWIPSKLLNVATGGALTDFRSPEELQEYYESGEDAIRKGRYWSIGSTTPWFGGKIERWQPNWYRRMKSDYKFSENGLGSESEYFANSWMPTLTHPLAPLRHFIFDRYHYENKLKDERPFAVTGGFAELDNIPLFGPLIDDTVGRLIKPRLVDPRLEKSHREYLEAYNERLASAYMGANSGAILEGMPSGGINRIDDAVNVDLGEAGGIESPMYEGDIYSSGALSEGVVGASGSGGGVGTGSGAGGSGGRTTVNDVSRNDLASLNASISATTSPTSRGISSVDGMRDPNVLYDLDNAIFKDSLTNLQYGSYRDVFYNASEIAGIFGFATKATSGFEEGGRGATLQDSSLMGSYNKAFWDMELGGLGGDISEIARRYLARDPNKNYYNPIRNNMPEFMPGAEYFTDFKHGDPYSKISAGLMRLPGEAYEKLYSVKKDEYGNYSALDRLRILGDVAPYSDQYRMAKKQVSLLNSNGLLSEEDNEEYKTIREQVKQKKEKKHFYDRKFNKADLDKETVTVTKVLDANTFVTKEYGEDNPIKLAGVQVKNSDQETVDFIRQFIYEGARVKVGLDADPLFRERDDLMNTMRAVVYTNHNEEGNPFYLTNKGANLNFMLANRPETKDKVTIRDDGTAVATAALYTKEQITVGRMYDTVVRDILPQLPIAGVFADKFLQVRSPVESYRRELYGKSWRDWASPWSGWIEPMVDTIASRNPIIAAAEGYGIGYMFGRNRSGGMIGLGLGAVTGLLATARTVKEIGSDIVGSDTASVPGRRQKEREMDEYFDKLKYVKFKGLYERAADMALEQEGFDVRGYIEEQDERGKSNKGLKKYIQEQKKRLSIQKKSGYGDIEVLRAELRGHNETLKEINDTRPQQKVGPLAALALRYKQEYEATIYAADENINFQNIYRALPAKDREYFTKFLEAGPEEREEILRLVPQYQRAIYQKSWGLEPDKKETLVQYFKKHPLPKSNWEGWQASKSLDSVRVKVMQNEGMELTEANYWDDDEARAMQSNAKAIPINGGGSLDIDRLQKVLKGAGLKDVQVSMSTIQGDGGIKAQMDIQLDRTKEVLEGMTSNWQNLFS